MNKIYRIKKTGQIVHKLFDIDSMHSLMLFPFKERSRKGNMGVSQSVRNDNLSFESQEPRMADR